jgi:transposase
MRIARSAAELGFQWYDRLRLAKALKRVREARTYRRLRAVLLVASGRAVKEVAPILGVSLPSLYNWVNRYLKGHSAEILSDKPRRGRPRVARRLTPTRLKRELGRDPLRLGYTTTTWTVPLLAKHLGRLYDGALSPDTLRRRMHEIGWRWKRPRHVFSDKEPHLPQKKGLSSAV